MVNCVVKGCFNHVNNSNRHLAHAKGITFHSFPKEHERKRVWIRAVLQDGQCNEQSRICSDHFEAKYFDRSGAHVRLTKFAVPTIFPDLKKQSLASLIQGQRDSFTERVKIRFEYNEDFVHKTADDFVHKTAEEFVHKTAESGYIVEPPKPQTTLPPKKAFQKSFQRKLAFEPATTKRTSAKPVSKKESVKTKKQSGQSEPDTPPVPQKKSVRKRKASPKKVALEAQKAKREKAKPVLKEPKSKKQKLSEPETPVALQNGIGGSKAGSKEDSFKTETAKKVKSPSKSVRFQKPTHSEPDTPPLAPQNAIRNEASPRVSSPRVPKTPPTVEATSPEEIELTQQETLALEDEDPPIPIITELLVEEVIEEQPVSPEPDSPRSISPAFFVPDVIGSEVIAQAMVERATSISPAADAWLSNGTVIEEAKQRTRSKLEIKCSKKVAKLQVKKRRNLKKMTALNKIINKLENENTLIDDKVGRIIRKLSFNI